MHIGNMQKYHSWIDSQISDGFVIFLGDSITQGLANQVVIPCSVNYGIGASSTFDLLNFIDYYRSLETASAIVLMIGINDFANGASRGIDDRIRNIVDRIPKTKPLVLNSIMPAIRDGIDNNIIKKHNQMLHQLCLSRGNCEYIDTWSFLVDHQNNVRANMFLDGVHLSGDGYAQWKLALTSSLNRIAPKAISECNKFISNRVRK